METTTKKQIETLLNGLFDLNDFNGNEGAIDYLEIIYIGFNSSQECEEMEGRDRANLTLFFMKLKKLLESSEGLTKQDIIDFKNQSS